MRNKNKIIHYANSGLDVESDTAALVTRFIAAMENANKKALPFTLCVNRAGWVKDNMVPTYMPTMKIVFQDDDDGTIESMKGHKGNKPLWIATGVEVRKHPFARAILAASFASPLLSKLQQRNIYYHSWANSKSGKTAALKFALSVWGDPKVLLNTYLSTAVGLERKAAMMKHLPLAIDEIQNLDRKLSLNNLVYTLGNGIGKVRGRAGGGTRTTLRWNNIILSTGEQPITNDESMDGVYTRVLEVYASPLSSQALSSQAGTAGTAGAAESGQELGHEIHQIADENYGFAGAEYIKFLVEEVLNSTDETFDETLGETSDETSATSETSDATLNINTLGINEADEADEESNSKTASGKSSKSGKSGKSSDADKDADNNADNNDDTADKDAKELAKEYAEADKKWRENLEQAKKAAGSKAGRLFADLETIISTLTVVYDRTDPKIRDIAIIALGDYYSSLSVFGLTEEDAMSEASSLACSLLENQMKIERKDSIDRAWEFTCGWVVRNKHKFITPTTIEINNEVYGRIDNEYCYVITDVLQKALKEAGFSSELKCIKGFAERGYIGTFEERGKPCIQPSKSIRGSNIRAYGLKIKSSLAGQSQSQAGLAGQDEEDILA